MKVSNAIANGSLKRLPCVKCGARDSEAHHEDYNLPLDVVWLCKGCHVERHYGLIEVESTG